jgi:predicted ribonuclease YlaK
MIDGLERQPDNRIVGTVLKIRRANNIDVTFATADINMKTVAKAYGIKAGLEEMLYDNPEEDEHISHSGMLLRNDASKASCNADSIMCNQEGDIHEDCLP